MTNPALLRNLELNRNHPQAAGLELAIPVVDGRYRDYVRHRRLTPTTGGTLSPAINSNAAIYKGLYSDGATTATFYTIADTPMLDVGTGNFCVMCRVVFYSLSGNNREIVGKGADNAGGIRYKINYTITGGNEFTGEVDDNTTKTVLASGVSASTNTPYHLALRRVGNRYDFFVNGVSQANATHTHNTLDNAHVFIVNNFVSATTPTYYTDRILDGVTNDVRLYKTIVPDDQMIFDIYANSWELYKPPRRVVFTPAAAAYTLVAAQGSYTLSGQGIGLLVSRLISAAQGSYTLSGQDTGLLIARLLAGGQGSFSLSGQSAGLFFGRLLTAAQGSYTLSGQNTGLLVARLLTAAQGSYTLSGQDVTLDYSGAGAYTLTADYGSFSLSGQTAATIVDRTITAAQGSYTLSGQDASALIARLLTAAQGSYTLTGVSVVLSYSGTVIGSVIEITDSAAYNVALSDSAKYLIVLTDSAAYVVNVAEELP